MKIVEIKHKNIDYNIVEIFPKKKEQIIDVSILLPTYNEIDNLKILIPKLENILSKLNISYEILIINDYTNDGTYNYILDLINQNKSIHLIERYNCKGLSSAIILGIQRAYGNKIIIMDSDLQHDENILPQFIKNLDNYDLVIGSRLVRGGSYGNMRLYRKILSFLANLLTRILFNLKVKDTMSGYFGLRKKILNEVFLEGKGFKILLEILIKGKYKSFIEIPYTFKERKKGKSKFNIEIIIDYIIQLIELKWHIKISNVVIKYLIVGFLGIWVNLFGQILVSELFNWHYIRGMIFWPSLSVFFGFELSVFFNFILNHYWTFALERMHNRKIISTFWYFIKFQIVSIYGFIIQISLWYFIVNLVYYNSPIIDYMANLLGILFATFNNYILNKNFTWSKDFIFLSKEEKSNHIHFENNCFREL